MKSQLYVLTEWFLFSICMFTLPFLSYFGTQYLLSKKYPEVAQESFVLGTLLPVFTAVLTVWVILAAYAYIAWRDEFRLKKAEEKKQEEKKDN